MNALKHTAGVPLVLGTLSFSGQLAAYVGDSSADIRLVGNGTLPETAAH